MIHAQQTEINIILIFKQQQQQLEWNNSEQQSFSTAARENMTNCFLHKNSNEIKK